MTKRYRLKTLRNLKNRLRLTCIEYDRQIHSEMCTYPDPSVCEKIFDLNEKRNKYIKIYLKVTNEIMKLHALTEEELDTELIIKEEGYEEAAMQGKA